MNVFELVAKISLDSSSYTTALDQASQQTATFSDKIRTGFSTLGKVAGVALGAGTAAAIGFTKSAISAGMDFDSAMSQVAATLGKSTDEIQDLRDFAQEMGATTSFSAVQAAEALNYMALAGYDAETSMKMLPTVLNLAAAGGMDLATASDMVTDAQTALGLSIDDTVSMVDQMARTASTTNTSVAQLGDAFLTVGGTAQYMFSDMESGITVTNELSKVLGILADNGIKGSEGGTKLRNMILSLSAPTDKAAKTLNDLGVSVFDASGNMRKFEDIFADLNEATRAFSDQQKVDILSNLFNARDVAAANALLNTNIDRWNDVSTAIGTAEGAANKMANTQLDNLSGDVTIFKSALEGLKIAVSDELTPTFRNLVQNVTKWISGLTDKVREGALTGAVEKLKTTVKSILPVFQDIIKFVGKVLDAWNQLPAGMQEFIIKAALVNAASAKLGIGFGDIAKGVVSLVGGFKNIPSLLAGTSTAFSGITSAMGGISTAFSSIGGVISSVIQTIGAIAAPIAGVVSVLAGAGLAVKSFVDMAVSGFSWVKEALMLVGIALAAVGAVILGAPAVVAGVVAAIVAAVATAFVLIKDNLDSIKEWFANLVSAALTLGGDIITAIGNGITAATEWLHTVVGELVSGLVTFFGTFTSVFMEIGGNLIDGLAQGISAAWHIITEFFTKAGEDLIGILDKIWTAMGDAAISAWTAIKEGLSQIWTAIIETASSIWSGITDFFGQIWNAINETAISIWTGIREFFFGVWNGVKESIEGVWSGIKDALISAWSAISDTAIETWTGIRDFLIDVWNGVKEAGVTAWDGIRDALSAAWNAVQELWAGAEGFFSDIWTGIKSSFSGVVDFFSSTFSQAASGMKGAWNGVSSFFSSLWTEIKGMFSDAVDFFKNIGGNILGGMWEGLKSGFDKLKENVTGIINSIKEMFTGKNGLDIHSPSKWAEKVFRYVMEGGSAGLNSGLPAVLGSVDDAVSQIKNGFDFDLDSIKLDASGDFPVNAVNWESAPEPNTNRAGDQGGDTFIFNSPKAIDEITAARELKKAKQQLALGY